jgi:4a-hydroxytetrahydrobiopterin dehydratase
VDTLSVEQINEAGLADWRKMGQGWHARFLTDGFSAGARFVAAIAEAADELGHHPRVTLGDGFVDLEAISDDAIHRDDAGVEHVVASVTQQDLDLARRISAIAHERGIRSDPRSVSTIEIALDTANSSLIASMWAALLTGTVDSRGRGRVGDDIRDATDRVPDLWFQDTEPHETPRQRFHLDVWVAPEVIEERVAAAVAAGGTVVDESHDPRFTVIADADGNRACVCTA